MWSLRHWVRIFRGHHGRLVPEVDFEVLAAAADELAGLRARVAALESEREAGETCTAVDWPARFRAAADRCFDLSDAAMLGIAPILGDLARRLEVQPDFVVEAIGRALLGETDETETVAELAGRDGDTTHA